MLAGRTYVVGDTLTEVDVRLFVTLVSTRARSPNQTKPTADARRRAQIRFDPVYFHHFKCNLRSVRDGYPALHLWLRRLYWTEPAFKDTCVWDHFKKGYYLCMPFVRRPFFSVLSGADRLRADVLVAQPAPDCACWARAEHSAPIDMKLVAVLGYLILVLVRVLFALCKFISTRMPHSDSASTLRLIRTFMTGKTALCAWRSCGADNFTPCSTRALRPSVSHALLAHCATSMANAAPAHEQLLTTGRFPTSELIRAGSVAH